MRLKGGYVMEHMEQERLKEIAKRWSDMSYIVLDLKKIPAKEAKEVLGWKMTV